MARKNKQLRYVEISHRNPITRLRVGYGSGCGAGSICGEDVCIEIRKAGQENCHHECRIVDNPCGCGCGKPKPLCDTFVARVCALEIDDEGFAVFEWPDNLKDICEGWYEGTVMTGCFECGKVPIRVGPRCNVIEVETEISGPDSKCAVGCEDPCRDDICYPKNKSSCDNGKKLYVPGECADC